MQHEPDGGGANVPSTPKHLHASSKKLKDYMAKFTAHSVFQTNPLVRVARCERTKQFEKLIDLTVRPFLVEFPTDNVKEAPWDKELAQFSEAILDLFNRGLLRLEGLFTTDAAVKPESIWIAQLVAFIRHMHVWDRRPSSFNDVPPPNSSRLCDLAIEVAANVLTSLGLETEEGLEEAKPWARFRDMLAKLLKCARDLAASSSQTYPLTLHLDTLSTSISEDSQGDPFADTEESNVKTKIESKPVSHDLGISLLNIVSRVLTRTSACKPFAHEIIHDTVVLACEVGETVLSEQMWSTATASGSSPESKGTTMLSASLTTSRRAVESITLLLEDPFIFTSASPAPPLLARLLALRAETENHDGADEGGEAVRTLGDLAGFDDLIRRSIIAIPHDSMPGVFALELADRLVQKNSAKPIMSKNLRSAIIAYVGKTSQSVALSVFHKIHAALSEKQPHATDDLGELRGLYSLPRVAQLRQDRPLSKRKRKRETGWREDMRACLEEALASTSQKKRADEEQSDDVSMEEDGNTVWDKVESASDKAWIKTVLKACCDQLESLEPSQVSVRATICAAIAKTMTVMETAAFDQEIPPHERPPVPNRLCLPAMRKCGSFATAIEEEFLDLPTFASALSFVSSGVICGEYADAKTMETVSFAAGAIVRPDRSVRVAAGRLFVVCFQACQTQGGEALRHRKTILDTLEGYCNSASQGVREVAISTIGGIGKIVSEDLLSNVIHLLVAQWGQESTLLKSLAYIYLRDVAKVHKKAPYAFLSPHLPKLITYVTANIASTPSLLIQLAKFISRSPADLLSFTLPHSLPSLVCTCSRDEINAVSNVLNRPVAALVIDRMTDILKAVFVLPEDKDSDEALQFLTQMVAEAAGAKAGSVATQALVNSCIATLLAELVMALGDERTKNVELARKALKRVELITQSTKQHKKPRDLATFLKPYILGIMTYLNEVLQEVQGRRTPAHKRQVLRSIGELIQTMGAPISAIAPQIMAAMQSLLLFPDFTQTTLETWKLFMTELPFRDVGPYIGSTSAAFVKGWSRFNPDCRDIAVGIMRYLIVEHLEEFKEYCGDVVSLANVPEFSKVKRRLDKLLKALTVVTRMELLLRRCASDNNTVALLSLTELRIFLVRREDVWKEWASGDMFHPIIGVIMHVLLNAASREGEHVRDIRVAAFECLGNLGALDPDRIEPYSDDPSMVVLHNFVDEGEAAAFALHLIRNLLVGAFRSTSDLRYQSHLAYAIQELLRFCKFTPDLIKTSGGNAVPVKIRNRWDSLPKHMLDTVAPLLEGKFSYDVVPSPQSSHPIFAVAPTYREWVQQWASHLVTRSNGPQAQAIFGSFRLAVRSQDAEVARYLLPHLILNVLISGEEDDSTRIREEVLEVLRVQTEGQNDDRKLLSAQTVFEVLDHLANWIRLQRQLATRRRAESRRSRVAVNAASEQAHTTNLLRVESVISSIDHDLLATAAFQCKAYARALMTLERVIVDRQSQGASEADLQPYYDRLHQIYASLEEPDGMEGVSAKVTAPSLDYQIRDHESIGRWTSAQSCWELKLQQSPSNIDHHLGLLRCLRNLGHHDTLLTHIKGVLTRYPEWKSPLAGLHAESAAKIGDWDAVRTALASSEISTSETTLATLLLALVENHERSSQSSAFRLARIALGAPLASGRRQSYRNLYDSIINLHVVQELQQIHSADLGLANPDAKDPVATITRLATGLASRFEGLQPSYAAREPILTMRRVMLQLSSLPADFANKEIGQAWIASAKIARKAGYSQTAYSANLQAAQWNAPFGFIESSKLIRNGGEPLRALQELDARIKVLPAVSPHTSSSPTSASELLGMKKTRAKALLLRARWMHETERYAITEINERFKEPSEACDSWESPWYRIGQFYDETVRQGNPQKDATPWVTSAHYRVINAFTKALRLGSKYTYQTVPRLLTLWLDPADHAVFVELEKSSNKTTADAVLLECFHSLKKVHQMVDRAIREVPPYQWMIAFPQIVSRIGHQLPSAYALLKNLIFKLLSHYPQQGLWYFTSVVQGKDIGRERRAKAILDELKQAPTKGDANSNTSTPKLITQWNAVTREFLTLSDIEAHGASELDMKKVCPTLYKLCPMSLILPLQESLTVTMPSLSNVQTTYQPFTPYAPSFHEFQDEIVIMSSLVKPKRVTIKADNGMLYSFLCKPKDDLRKDARLMDFYSMINKLLKANSESRRRRLHIRTYAVTPLNETCGLIEWVPNVLPFRLALIGLYEARTVNVFRKDVSTMLDQGRKNMTPEARGEQFTTKVLTLFPPVFHEWLLATWPEPGAWLSARLAYGRSSAVMSMVGSILGLGDRHGENILLDTVSGDVLHVDFNCLFDKGKTFEVPEVTPFRLTQNVVDGLGVTDVEGVFRNSAEITMSIMRANADSLINILEAFIHDPLVEWQHEQNQRERESKMKTSSRSRSSLSKHPLNAVPTMQDLATKYLGPVQRRLNGINTWKAKKGFEADKGADGMGERPRGVPAFVEFLIKEARDSKNLASMYPGWAPWL